MSRAPGGVEGFAGEEKLCVSGSLRPLPDLSPQDPQGDLEIVWICAAALCLGRKVSALTYQLLLRMGILSGSPRPAPRQQSSIK